MSFTMCSSGLPTTALNAQAAQAHGLPAHCDMVMYDLAFRLLFRPNIPRVNTCVAVRNLGLFMYHLDQSTIEQLYRTALVR